MLCHGAKNADCSLQIEYKEGCWRGTLLPEAVTTAAAGRFTLKLQEGGRCYVFGGGHVSQALVPLLAGVGFSCVVLDERPDYTTPALFPAAETRCGVAAGACSRHSLFCRRQCHYHDEGASGGL